MKTFKERFWRKAVSALFEARWRFHIAAGYADPKHLGWSILVGVEWLPTRRAVRFGPVAVGWLLDDRSIRPGEPWSYTMKRASR